MTDSPIPMRLCCEACGTLHIDEGEFRTKPHHTHSCQHCGLTWRPAVVATVGVQFLPGFKNDPPVTSIILGHGHIGPIEIGSSWKRKSDGAVLRVVELGSYVTGERKILLDNGRLGNGRPHNERLVEGHNERYLRENFIALGMIGNKPTPSAPLSIRCIVSGEDVYVLAGERDTLGLVRDQAFREARLLMPLSDDFVSRCQIRNIHGIILRSEAEVKDTLSLQYTDKPTLYINPPVGSGG